MALKSPCQPRFTVKGSDGSAFNFNGYGLCDYVVVGFYVSPNDRSGRTAIDRARAAVFALRPDRSWAGAVDGSKLAFNPLPMARDSSVWHLPERALSRAEFHSYAKC